MKRARTKKPAERFTPGPWVAKVADNGNSTNAIDIFAGKDQNVLVASIINDRGDLDPEDRANGDLLAASPDTLAALRRCVEVLNDSRVIEYVFRIGHDVDLAAGHSLATGAALAAINKAVKA